MLAEELDAGRGEPASELSIPWEILPWPAVLTGLSTALHGNPPAHGILLEITFPCLSTAQDWKYNSRKSALFGGRLLQRRIYPINEPPGDPQLGKDAPHNHCKLLLETPAEPKISCPEFNSFLSLHWACRVSSQVRSMRAFSKTGLTSLNLVIHYHDKVIRAWQSLSPPAAPSLCTNIRALA